MPRREGYVPKHRGPVQATTPKKGLRSTVLLSGVAVAATGIAVSSGVLAQQDAEGNTAGPALRAAPRIVAGHEQNQDIVQQLEDRQRSTSRSDRRTSVDKKADDKADKKKTASRDRSARGRARTKQVSDNPRDIARALLPRYGFSADQFGCLDALYVSESDWNPRADNPTSSAYGIPQALTETHDDLPADYMTNPASQIKWGLNYIRSSYGTPCSAWEFKQANNWY
ncbi:MAG TPA: transglycosylase SLT domain-containing protein [Nocardioides sp.]|uniref:aggregation-promoting factor C-terminal-like domain-containing protein n=1 Tax=Nocardioides sp. TaxID=35761 RepID=UPI002D7FC38B|nr:transglycosylase SLT domain-containing protein [Nocardioides sp.]HET6654087.1 transglycosylase SLT domain-containing protein [Nocardioides sp.]